MRYSRRRLGLLVLLLFVGGGMGSGCISILALGECQVNGDCASLHGAGWVCKQDGVGAPKRCVSTSPQIVCSSDADCPSSSTCVSGTCQQGASCECSSDADCASGERCASCRCIQTPIVGRCQTDADCNSVGAGFVCNPVGNCVSASDECTSSADCNAETEICSGGQCVKKRLSCVQDQNCPAGRRCVGSVCEEPGVCLLDRHCEGATPVCNVATQKCVQCVTDSDCSVEQVCRADGVCEGKKPCECQRSSQCPGSQRCEKCQCIQGPGPIIVREGEVCDEQEAPNGNTKTCTVGFGCVRFSQLGGGARCARLCRPNFPEDCGHNEKLTCLTYGSADGKGICAYIGCKDSQECPFQGFSCQRFNGAQACLPTLASGSVRYGGVCKAVGLASDCSRETTSRGIPDAICLRSAASDRGVCTSGCSESNKCAPFFRENGPPMPTICVPFSGTNHCALECKQVGGACPDGMSCQKQSSAELCLPVP